MNSEKTTIGFIGAAIGAAAMFVASLFSTGGDKAASPVEETFNPCPIGWDYTGERDHVVVLQCSNENGWVVLLNSDFTFNNGLNTKSPTAEPIFDELQVPDWHD